MRRPPRGFTIHELIVVILIILVLIAMLLPAVHTGHRGRRMVGCASNLRQIGYMILVYQKDNRGAFPRTRASRGPVRVPTWGTGAAATDPFAADGPAENDVTAGLFLLLRKNQITPRVFVCPASNQEPDPLAGDGSLPLPMRSNFTDVSKHLSYSYQDPYPNDAAVAGAFIAIRYGTFYALAADKNPGAAGGNSMNHDLRGQNVLYADGHVAWQAMPLAGPVAAPGGTPDHIYNTKAGTIIASPTDLQTDNILLPTD